MIKLDMTDQKKWYGQKFVSSIEVSNNALNVLFSALLSTSILVFALGNILLINKLVFTSSLEIMIPCIGFLGIFYAISRTMHSVLCGLVITYIIICGTALTTNHIYKYAYYILMIVGVLYTIKNLRINPTQWGNILLIGLIGAIVSLGSNTQITFDMLRNVSEGAVHKDTLYHASIAAMIKNYGVVSTGLEGLVETPYHVLSHIMYASISILSGVSVLEVYGVVTGVLFVPLLIFSIVASCVMLEKSLLEKISLLWCVVCGVLVVFPEIFISWGLFASYLVSESYMISLSLFVLSMPYLYKTKIEIHEMAMLIISVSLMSLGKPSVGLIYLAIWVVRVLFFNEKIIKAETLGLGIASIITLVGVFKNAKSASGDIMVCSPLHFDFIGRYCFLGGSLINSLEEMHGEKPFNLVILVKGIVSIASFFIMHYIASWLIVIISLKNDKINIILKRPIVAYMLVPIVCGTIIIMNMYIYGGSEYYFSNISYFISIPVLSIMIVNAIHFSKKKRIYFMVAITLLIAALNFSYIYNKSQLAQKEISHEHKLFIASLRSLKDGPLNVVMNPIGEPHKNNPILIPSAQPFVYPAVSERPWINVITKENIAVNGNIAYGYGSYKINYITHTVTVKPVLLPGMEIENHSF